MPRPDAALIAVACCGIFLILAPAHSAAPVGQPTGLEIEDFSYLDTSGEPTNQAAEHQVRLRALMSALKHDVEADRRYRLLPSSCAPPCASQGPVTSERLDAASEAGANILIIGAIQKMSTLVQWAKVSAIDVDARRVLFEKLFTYRGDNDEAWQRAEAFMSREIRETLASSLPISRIAAPQPTKLAVFTFELEDASASAPASGQTTTDEADATELAKVTNAVRNLFAQSDRYRLIEVHGANADTVKTNTLHDCGGCEAKIALNLGADQSLIGVVRRISRTEYTIRFLLREARTGAVIADADSGLRMGANYSWSRGAVRLINDRLLDSPSQR